MIEKKPFIFLSQLKQPYFCVTGRAHHASATTFRRADRTAPSGTASQYSDAQGTDRQEHPTTLTNFKIVSVV